MQYRLAAVYHEVRSQPQFGPGAMTKGSGIEYHTIVWKQ